MVSGGKIEFSSHDTLEKLSVKPIGHNAELDSRADVDQCCFIKRFLFNLNLRLVGELVIRTIVGWTEICKSDLCDERAHSSQALIFWSHVKNQSNT